ncbi:MAG: hypothetical protein AB1489_26745 [Acidobacteriota bacterium]
MSRKSTKPPAKSEKDDASIRSSPATRALRFLLGKQSPAQADLPPISPEIEIADQTSSNRASSEQAGSVSQLREERQEAPQPPVSQPVESQLLSSQLSQTPVTSSRPATARPFHSEALVINWRAIEHTRIPQVVFDEILPQLPPMAQTPYLQLLRLTLGFQRATCHISLESWAARCNQSLASIKRQATLLQQRGLLRKETVIYGGAARGSYYRPVIPGILNDEMATTSRQLSTSQLSASQLNLRQLGENNMKTDHEDPGKETDPHQSWVMKIYTELTGNRATASDLAAYRKIAHLDAATIEGHMRQIYQRSTEPIGSFAYFTKGVLKATAEGVNTRAAQKRSLTRIIERIRTNNVGGRASLADLIEEIKRACARDNVIYNTDLVNEILGL